MKSYLITDPKYYGDNALDLEASLDVMYSHFLPDFTLFRDKITHIYPQLAKVFLDISREYKISKVFLHQDVDLAHRLGADGVHLNSSQFDDIKKAKKLNLEVVFSTHNLIEAQKAIRLGCDYITYSPIFHSPNKGEPLGLENLKDLIDKISVRVFALGGVVDDMQVKMLQECGVYGFASIRYFIKG